ncbi:growth factor receptor-bound protein [Anopheles darlingi]|uniref:Growth factor receptor-bound protein n=1 Tax=Anopheles darlingi TaxID=43151 RepID=W5JE07_ANODA|nr:growth factor receptor-bound protein [Anopheles darlingi]
MKKKVGTETLTCSRLANNRDNSRRVLGFGVRKLHDDDGLCHPEVDDDSQFLWPVATETTQTARYAIPGHSLIDLRGNGAPEHHYLVSYQQQPSEQPSEQPAATAAASFDINGTTGTTAAVNNVAGGSPAAGTATATTARLRPKSNSSSSERTDSYRFSMANLEETQEAELDAILGELSILEEQGELRHGRSHSRTNSTISAATNTTLSSESGCSSVAADTICSGGSIASGMVGTGGAGGGIGAGGGGVGMGGGGMVGLHHREPRTDSPDNDSAFSDTVSLMSSESSASSSVSTSHLKHLQSVNGSGGGGTTTGGQQGQQMLLDGGGKAAKIHLALQKLEQASVRRLFVKAFSADGASKSLLIDETMSCGHVTRLLADKNHVQMEPTWAIVEHLPEHQMERLFEDHEMLVDNLMLWNRDSKNRVLFLRRPDKVALFRTPEAFLPGTQMAPGSEHDEHTRAMLLDEFFNQSAGNQIALEGPLYMKNDAKKGWKKYHFVLRASGLHYYPKEKTRSAKDLLCLALFAGHEVYRGLGWKKKHKAPTDFTFALRCPKVPAGVKGIRSVKMLCAEDAGTLEQWVTAIRVMKYGKKLLDNHRLLLDDLAREELDKLSSARSSSIGSIVSSVPSQCSTSSSNSSSSGGGGGSVPNHLVPGNGHHTQGNANGNGRLSRASSSSSSGCLSDENNGFDSEFPTGTIKRKPSMKPNLPLTSMTRQLKEVGETTRLKSDGSAIGGNGATTGSVEQREGGTLTRRHSRRRSEESTGSGTLKRRPMTNQNRGSIESMSSSASTPTPVGSLVNTPVNFEPPTNILSTGMHQGTLGSPGNASAMSSPLNGGTPTIIEPIPSCMTDSTFSLPPPPPPPTDDPMLGVAFSGSTLSLDSLPPPPPQNELDNSFSGSQLSLASVQIPPPPPPSATLSGTAAAPVAAQGPVTIAPPMAPPAHPLNGTGRQQEQQRPPPLIMPSVAQSIMKLNQGHCHTLPTPSPPATILKKEPIYSKTLKPSALKAPPYKSPPPYNGGDGGPGSQPDSPAPPAKSVSFAESPVLLRRKVCFEDEILDVPPSPRRLCASYGSSAGPPVPPPRAEATRLSTTYTSPKRLSESSSNPPRDFLKDLQRVMNKKWQVAQKCKLEPATTPHEVLGFRDIHGAGGVGTELYSSATPFYRETANVSNWVQEHYGAPDGLYENLGSNMGIEPNYPITSAPNNGLLAGAAMPGMVPLASSAKKRPPPPPPKRSEKTQLTTTGTPQHVPHPHQHQQHPHHHHHHQQQQQQQQHSCWPISSYISNSPHSNTPLNNSNHNRTISNGCESEFVGVSVPGGVSGHV